MSAEFPKTMAELQPIPVESFVDQYTIISNEERVVKPTESPFDLLLQMAIKLRENKKYEAAAAFFGKALTFVPNSADALMARLSCLNDIGSDIDPEEVEKLKSINENYHAFFLAKRLHKLDRTKSREILQILQNKFEGFHTGAEADWIFIEHAARFHQTFSNQNSYRYSPIPKTIFMYWDKDPPPEIKENFDRHRKLEGFNLVVHTKESAIEFLRLHYGSDCRRMFLDLRHPSEESDFIRFHAIHAIGGYYLDVDERIRSTEHFNQAISSNSEAVFIISQNPDGALGPVHSAFFGSVKGHAIIEDAIMTIYRNMHYHASLSLWLKSGPGPITRAISRAYFRSYFLGYELPSFQLLPPDRYPRLLEAVDVSYRNDERDWRIHEARKA